MVIAIDAATPARVNATASPGAVTTAAFDAPAGCILVACGGGDAAASSLTITNNGAALTWNLIQRHNSSDGGNNGVAQGHWAVIESGRPGLTVTGTLSPLNDVSLKIYVVTGADSVNPLGGSAEGHSTTASTFNTGAMTAAAASSMGFWVANDWNGEGVPTSTDSTVDGYGLEPEISGGSGYRQLNGGAGASETFSITSPSGSATAWNYVLFEIKDGGGGGGVTLDRSVPVFTIQIP